jgi:hypothetical protein
MSDGGIVTPLLLLFLDGSQKTPSHIAFGRRFDQCVSVLRTVAEFLFQLLDSTLKAGENFVSFLMNMG